MAAHLEALHELPHAATTAAAPTACTGGRVGGLAGMVAALNPPGSAIARAWCRLATWLLRHNELVLLLARATMELPLPACWALVGFWAGEVHQLLEHDAGALQTPVVGTTTNVLGRLRLVYPLMNALMLVSDYWAYN